MPERIVSPAGGHGLRLVWRGRRCEGVRSLSGWRLGCIDSRRRRRKRVHRLRGRRGRRECVGGLLRRWRWRERVCGLLRRRRRRERVHGLRGRRGRNLLGWRSGPRAGRCTACAAEAGIFQHLFSTFATKHDNYSFRPHRWRLDTSFEMSFMESSGHSCYSQTSLPALAESYMPLSIFCTLRPSFAVIEGSFPSWMQSRK